MDWEIVSAPWSTAPRTHQLHLSASNTCHNEASDVLTVILVFSCSRPEAWCLLAVLVAGDGAAHHYGLSWKYWGRGRHLAASKYNNNSNNGPELSSQMFSSGPNPAILKCLSSSLVFWSGLVWWCARGCAEVMYCLIINPKLTARWPSIRRCLQSAAGHDDQLMIPVSSTLSSAPSPHSPMASGAMAMEQIV